MFIGNFTPVGDNFTGTIKTLTFKIDVVVRAHREEEREGSQVPHRHRQCRYLCGVEEDQ
jgi:uncharacterized protein (DUF736 family)